MQIRRIQSTDAGRIKKVAVYARVSSLEEEQNDSYESQKQYYEAIIRATPGWEFAGMYADHGISGTTKDRPEFQKMIDDAKAGLLDIIMVKSISRFARNAIDTQNVVHELKAHNVEVYFDEQKISSFNRNMEMLLNMMAVVAEHESRSISQNTRWSYEKLAQQGIRRLGNNRVYGYDEIEGELIPNDNAPYVRLIYQMYAAGNSYKEIADQLKKAGAKPQKTDTFTAGTLRGILRNELYCGDMRIQKYPPVNLFTKKRDPSIPYVTYYAEEHHTPIVSRELWDRVKERLDSKQKEIEKGVYRTSKSHFLMGRILCGECGEQMRRITYGSANKRRKVWKCHGRTQGNGCKNDVVNEEELFKALSMKMEIPWKGIADMQEEDFANLKEVSVSAKEKIVLACSFF